MKNYRIKILFFSLLLWASCDKTLELEPFESLPTQEALEDLPGIQTALRGVYNTLQSYEYYGNLFLLYPELLGDLVYVRHFGANSAPNVLPRVFYAYDMSPAVAPSQVWNACYRVIFQTNNIIENIDRVEGGVVEKRQIKGEALALRAMAHFDLVRFFARPYSYGNPAENLGIPIVLNAVPYDYQPFRNSVKEVYSQVTADLDSAIGLMGKVGPYRFSDDAAKALLARVSLYKEDWDKAEQLTTDLIGRYLLEDDIVDMFTAAGSSEEIFTLKFEKSDDRGTTHPLEDNNLGANYIPVEPYGGRGVVAVSDDLLDLYEPGDKRRDFIQPFPDPINEYYHTKFKEQDGVLGLYSPKLLRIAEVYLIRAEARFRKIVPDIPGALDDLNTLRLKRGASEWTSLPTGTIKDILQERQRELAFEGHTSFDYWRTGTVMVRDQCNQLVQFQIPENNCEIHPSDHRTVQPIPQQEMDANPNMKQNDEYDK